MAASSPFHTATSRKPLTGPALAEYTKKFQYDFSDPRRFGQGSWMTFMIAISMCASEQERLFVCGLIRRFCRFCKCGECSGHCKKYVETHPPELFAAVSNEALFEWVATFMSAVNVRLGKPAYDVAILKKLFSDDQIGVCATDCGSGSSPGSGKVVALQSKPAGPPKETGAEWKAKRLDTMPGILYQGRYGRGQRSEWGV